MSSFWADQLAEKIVERAGNEKRKPNVKCQQTPSGGKHIGNLNDVLRAYFPVKACEEKGVGVDFVHTTDDRDPLKDIPAKLADLDAEWHSSSRFPWLKDEIGKPLVLVKDPFGCCDSWAKHFTSVWMDGVYSLGVNPTLYSVDALYKEKKLEPFVVKTFEKIADASSIVKKFQESKAEGYIPFDAICPDCQKLANVDAFNLKTRKVHFTCGGKAIKKKKSEGCGFEGEVGFSQGKLQWRFEWPALWALFHTTFEPFGKDHAEGSWKSGVEIARRVFEIEPPIPFVYEFFLVNNEKMSASKGNVYIVQDLLEIVEPEVFLFFYTKRPEMQRNLELSRAWQMVDEFDATERVYFGVEEARSENREENSKRMYEMTMSKIPAKCPNRISYSFAAAIAQVMTPEKAVERLEELGHLDAENADDVKRAKTRLKLALNWAEKHAPAEAKVALVKDNLNYQKLGVREKQALKQFAEVFMNEGEERQGEELKRIAEANGLKVQDTFKAAYMALIGRERGPKLIPFINALDKEEVRKRLAGQTV